MKIENLQGYFRALAEAMGADKGAGKDLAAIAGALDAFANRSVEELATFIGAAAAKYHETGELPDGKPLKVKPQPKVKPPRPTADALSFAVAGFKLRAQRNETLTRDEVEAALRPYEKLTKGELDGVTDGVGFPAKSKTKAAAIDALVTHVLAGQTAAQRAEV